MFPLSLRVCLLLLYSSSGMWPPALSVMRCVCVLSKSWLTHTEMYDNDRLRPRVQGAVQSTGAGRKGENCMNISWQSELKKYINIYTHVLQRHKSHCRQQIYLRITYVHLLPDQGDPHQAASGGPHLKLFPPLSSWGRQPLGSNYALWKKDTSTD